jgi:hypothetical protein
MGPSSSRASSRLPWSLKSRALLIEALAVHPRAHHCEASDLCVVDDLKGAVVGGADVAGHHSLLGAAAGRFCSQPDGVLHQDGQTYGGKLMRFDRQNASS